MARVSSRTLRHYDHIGLLPPTRAGHTRWYSRRDLLRLQHILLLRALGLGLDDVAAVLDGGTDEVAALRHHHARLTSEAERLLRVGRHRREDHRRTTGRHADAGERDLQRVPRGPVRGRGAGALGRDRR
jgi:DNA-binding transcriptional MerR regulator